MNSSLFENIVGKSRTYEQPAYQQPTQNEHKNVDFEASGLVVGESDLVGSNAVVNRENFSQEILVEAEAKKVEVINTETSSVAGGGSVDMNMLMAHMQSGNMNPAQLQQMMMFMNMQG